MAMPWLAFQQAFTQALPVRLDALAGRVREGVVVVACALGDWQAFLGQANALLDDAEIARAGRQRDPRKRDALVLAYALHRLLLGAATGRGPDRVAIDRDEKGCPRMREDALHTSLSHADDRVAFAVSAAGPLGVDLEPADRAAEMEEIMPRVVHADEAPRISALPPDARGRALLDLWVCKEALLKAAGIGLACEMDAFAVPAHGFARLPAGRHAGMEMALHAVGAGARWSLVVACPPGLRVHRMLLDATGRPAP